jgi:3-oxoacyl-[acyl-carrier protein] reductase
VQGNSKSFLEKLVGRSYILITGGSGGIGSSVCKLLSKLNIYPIIGFKRNKKHAEFLSKTYDGFPLYIDMGNADSVHEALNNILDNFKEKDDLKGVILCASPPPDIISFVDLKPEHFINQFNVNVVGAQILISGLIKYFFKKKNFGNIIGVLSEALGSDKQQLSSGMSSYIVAKKALETMLLACALENRWLNIKNVYPGFTDTKMLNAFDSRFLELIKLKKPFLQPDNVADVIIKQLLL